ncbi:hypothetical protein GCM10010425_01080 [Streptomyces spororaveus]|uniref:Uncharacterized protein n=1 Tax=Streptomyces spororaveus TaxID=284039 RepID=A0ABQ3TCI9_9ACTN|nr:hypothetical protein Sspor_36870 [Streptomyces spororaveus]
MSAPAGRGPPEKGGKTIASSSSRCRIAVVSPSSDRRPAGRHFDAVRKTPFGPPGLSTRRQRRRRAVAGPGVVHPQDTPGALSPARARVGHIAVGTVLSLFGLRDDRATNQ